MDSFESVVATILEQKGYWVRSSFKVKLTPKEKKRIGRPSSPRWELDIVAYRVKSREVLIMECKSYLDSKGVQVKDLMKVSQKGSYKLFTDRVLRTVVFRAAKRQLIRMGACRRDAKLRLGLAAGKIAAKSFDGLKEHFKKNKWRLFHPALLRKNLKTIAAGSYENKVAAVVAKLLHRI